MPYAKPETRTRAVKVSFGRGVANDDHLRAVIQSAVERHHVITQRATWLLKLYCLSCNVEELVAFDEELVKHCLFISSG